MVTIMVEIKKCAFIKGKTIDFRDANVEDSKFILSMRLDPILGKHLSKTSSSINDQVNYMKRYQNCNDQAFFIIQNKDSKPLGCIRIYNPDGTCFEWGSWLLVKGALPQVALESSLMMYKYALKLGFTHSIISTRKKNKTVWNFHQKIFSAQVIDETSIDYFLKIEKVNILNALEKFSSFLV